MQEAREGGVTTIQDLTSAEQLQAYQDAEPARRADARGSTSGRRYRGRARRRARPVARVRRRVAEAGRLQGLGGWHHGQQRGAVLRALQPRPAQPRHPPPRDVPRGTRRGRDVDEARRPLHRLPPGNLERLVKAAAKLGVPPHVHAIGDLGNRILLDVYERVLTEDKLLDTDHRWRVIHAQTIHPDDYARFGKLKLVAEVNPYHISDDMRWMEERIGPERSRGAYPFRKLKQAGAVLVFGSDSPGTNAARYYLTPVYGLYAAVTRQTLTGEPEGGWFPDQRLTIEEAIEAYTKDPRGRRSKEIKGTLAPGKLADIAVFDRNLVEIGKTPPADLLKAKGALHHRRWQGRA